MNPISLLLVPRARPSLPLPLRTSASPPNSARAAAAAARLAPAPARRQRARLPSRPVSAVAAEAPSPFGVDSEDSEGRFDWLDQWCPFAPVFDLDPGAPHGKKVLGLRVVAWHDRAAEDDGWRVFDDACPHRLDPLSEGRIDGRGRLQCAYHGWCFDGRGSCQFIPQAPALGPQVHKNSKACAASYPSVVQNNVLWFYPRADAEHRHVLQRKRPPFFPQIDDPSFITGVRDLPYGYDVLVENLLDPAHIPYAHKGLMTDPPEVLSTASLRKKEDPKRAELDAEAGGPVKMKIEEANVDGFLSPQQNGGYFRYTVPFIICISSPSGEAQGEEKKTKKPQFTQVFMCIPVAPGRRRLITAFVSEERRRQLARQDRTTVVLPHCAERRLGLRHLYLLHVEERNFVAAGVENWQKAVYVPTSSDGMVVAFRNWFRKHCKNQVGWAAPTIDQLPATPTKDNLMERYWSHVAQCRSCSAALKAMKALEVALQATAAAVVVFLSVSTGTPPVATVVNKAAVVSLAVLCFAASRWLTNFYFQDYIHAYK